MLDNVDARFADPTHGPPLRERVWWTRETLARSVEGRSVEMVTVTDPEGMDPARAPGSVRVPEGRQVFVVTCGVHPGEKPANHMLCGVLEFLLRADDREPRRRQRTSFASSPCSTRTAPSRPLPQRRLRAEFEPVLRRSGSARTPHHRGDLGDADATRRRTSSGLRRLARTRQ